MAQATYCAVCLTIDRQKNDRKWIGCDYCGYFCHKKCVCIDTSISDIDIKKLKWLCPKCVVQAEGTFEEVHDLRRELQRRDLEIKENADRIAELENKLDSLAASSASSTLPTDLTTKVDILTKNVDEIKLALQTITVPKFEKMTYAEKVKEKNLLIIKSTQASTKITERKSEVQDALKDIQIHNTRSTTDGNVIVNFANEEIRNEAASKISSLADTETKKIGKLKPKIMICNVYSDEDDVKNTLIQRNCGLDRIQDVDQKMTILFNKDAAGGTKHYFLKCDPEVRKAIHDNGDKVMLRWDTYDIRDRYHVLTCYHCQRCGHLQKECKFKGDLVLCGKCSENHETKECNSEQMKCINCTKMKKSNDHVVNSRNCEAYEMELRRLAEKTDHGY